MTFTLIPELAIGYLIVFARLASMFTLMPAIGEAMIPGRSRLALALLLTILVFPTVRAQLPIARGDDQALIRLFISEIAIGLIFGLSVRFLMSALQIAGSIVALQMGLSFAQTLDPSTRSGQEAVLGNLLTLLAITLIFAGDLHHVTILGMAGSYELLPPGMLPATADLSELALRLWKSSFATAVQISAPFLVFGLVFNVGLAILSRMMPQVQIFFLAMPATLLVGTIVLIAVLSTMMNGFLAHYMAGLRLIFPGV